ncbi:MAG: hypothetical protein JST85_29370 [Acidobacteria bacterium]|nr:hypothetical protein [Acidobacteriota bacterium]
MNFGLSQTGQAIVLGGLSAGVLDFTAACVTNASRGVTPVRIGQSIASGLLGRAAFNGGYKTAALGVVLHFVIAFGAATVFCLAGSKLHWLVARPWLNGALFGIAVFWFMQLIVLPLSAISFKQNFSWQTIATGMIVHIMCVGWPIALAARWRAK